MEFQDYLRVVWKHWKAVASVTVLMTTAAFALALVTAPQYRTQASVFFSVADGSSYNEIAQGSAYSQRQVVSFAELATSTIVLKPVIRELEMGISAGDLKKRLSIDIPTDTSIVNISATDPSPERAAEVANAVADELKAVSFRLAPKHDNGDVMVQATVTTPAVVPEAQISPRPRINLVIGLALGLGLGVALAVFREVVDNKIRREEDVRQLTSAPVLGLVAYEKTSGSGPRPLVGSIGATSRAAEAYNKLRLNLQFIKFAEGSHVMTVVSAMPNEGKTTTAVDLAISMSLAGNRVLLIDGDLRKPSVASVMGLEGSVGLTSVLIGEAELGDVVQKWGPQSLDVLTAGILPPNPSDLLDSENMEALLRDMRPGYDSIIIDAPPLLPVSDGHILNKFSDGALLIVAAGSTTKSQFAKAATNIERLDGRILGVVINKVQSQELQETFYAYVPEDEVPAKRKREKPAGIARRRRATKTRMDRSSAGSNSDVVESGTVLENTQ